MAIFSFENCPIKAVPSRAESAYAEYFDDAVQKSESPLTDDE